MCFWPEKIEAMMGIRAKPNGTLALSQDVFFRNLEERCSWGQTSLEMLENFSITTTEPRLLVSVKTKEGSLCRSVELPMMAAPSSEKAHGMNFGIKRDCRSPALLMPIMPAILVPSLAMFASRVDVDHESQSVGNCLGRGCNLRYVFGMRADAKGELKYGEIHFIS